MSASTSRSRSQRKASSLATAAITLQSSDDYGKIARGTAQQQAQQQQQQLLANRALTIRERQKLEEEDAERREKERSGKRRKVQRRLDELERTNPRDPLGSAALGSSSSTSAATNRNDGEAFSIPNSAVAAAVSRAYEGMHKSDTQHQSPSGTPGPVPIKRPTGGPISTSGGSTTASHPTVRRLILYRRNLHTLLDSAMQTSDVFKTAPHNYLSASSVAEKARLVKDESKKERKIKTKFKRSDSKDKALVSAAYATPSYMTVSRRPIFCTICGDSGEVNCPRCGDRTCVRGACLETHNDTRCDRPIR